MYIDAFLLFEDGTVSASGNSANVVDLSSDRNVGIGEPLSVVLAFSAVDNGEADETYQVELETASDEAFTAPSTISTVTVSRDLGEGKAVLPLPADLSADQFLRLKYTFGGTTPSATFKAFIIPTNMIDNYVQYADGFTIS